jgi:hypothetical protein
VELTAAKMGKKVGWQRCEPWHDPSQAHVNWITIRSGADPMLPRPQLNAAQKFTAQQISRFPLPSGAVNLGGGAQTRRKGTLVLKVVGARSAQFGHGAGVQFQSSAYAENRADRGTRC